MASFRCCLRKAENHVFPPFYATTLSTLAAIGCQRCLRTLPWGFTSLLGGPPEGGSAGTGLVLLLCVWGACWWQALRSR